MARRLLLIKADGSVSIHADDRAYKPLNWMSPPCWLSETTDGAGPDGAEQQLWVVTNKGGEELRITIEEIEHDSSHELGIDPGSRQGRRRGASPGVAGRARRDDSATGTASSAVNT